jgi:nucleoside-diphosphate-sugar epimerase
MSTLLIIGGSGYFGKSILDSYSRGMLEKWSIKRLIILARNATGLRSSTPYLLDNSISLFDQDIVKCDWLPQAEYVIHAAASSDATKYVSNPIVERNNILDGANNFNILAKRYLKDSKILYISSGVVYGGCAGKKILFREDDQPLSIKSLPENKRNYALGKINAEAQIADLGDCGLNVSIARCFAFVGKFLPLEQHFAIGNFINAGFKNMPIRVSAKSLVYRSYMHSDDLVEWLMEICNFSSIDCPIFNVGSDEGVLISDLALKIGKKFGQDIENLDISDEIGDCYLPSIEKAFRQLGLKIKINLDQAIDRTIIDLQNNQFQ